MIAYCTRRARSASCLRILLHQNLECGGWTGNASSFHLALAGSISFNPSRACPPKAVCPAFCFGVSYISAVFTFSLPTVSSVFQPMLLRVLFSMFNPLSKNNFIVFLSHLYPHTDVTEKAFVKRSKRALLRYRFADFCRNPIFLTPGLWNFWASASEGMSAFESFCDRY